MRKTEVCFVLITVLLFCFAGCSGKKNTTGYEDPVTLEQVNTEGRYVARGFLEAIFTDDRELFNKCTSRRSTRLARSGSPRPAPTPSASVPPVVTSRQQSRSN